VQWKQGTEILDHFNQQCKYHNLAFIGWRRGGLGLTDVKIIYNLPTYGHESVVKSFVQIQELFLQGEWWARQLFHDHLSPPCQELARVLETPFYLKSLSPYVTPS
jgi:hypothetical protein